jgi:hypothetical protein
MLPALASIEDLEARLQGGLAESDQARAQAVLEDASTLVRRVAGSTWVEDEALVDDVPDVVIVVTLAVAKRAFLNPDGIRQESLGTHSVTYEGANGVFLTDDERDAIQAAVGAKPGLWTLRTTRGDFDLDDCYLDVVGDEPIAACDHLL